MTLYLKAEAMQQSCDSEVPDLPCLSVQTDMCSAGQNGAAPRWPEARAIW